MKNKKYTQAEQIRILQNTVTGLYVHLEALKKTVAKIQEENKKN